MTQEKKDKIIKKLREKLAEAEKIEVEQPKRWKPKYCDKYYYVDNLMTVDDDEWDEASVDEWRYITGNCFKTREEAAEYEKQIEYTALYKNYIEERSEPLNWEGGQRKWYAEIKTDEESIKVNGVYSYKQQGVIYASSEEIIWDAIKEIGEDNFKKYVLGVK